MEECAHEMREGNAAERLREVCKLGTVDQVKDVLESTSGAYFCEKTPDGSTALNIARKRSEGGEEIVGLLLSSVFAAAKEDINGASYNLVSLLRCKGVEEVLVAVFTGSLDREEVYEEIDALVWKEADNLLKPVIDFVEDQDPLLWEELERYRCEWFRTYCKARGPVSIDIAKRLIAHLGREATAKLLITAYDVDGEEMVPILGFEENASGEGKEELFRYCIDILDENEIRASWEDIPSLLTYYVSTPVMLDILLERIPEEMMVTPDERGESPLAFALQRTSVSASPPLLKILETTPTYVLCQAARDTGSTCFLHACRNATPELLKIVTERIPEEDRYVCDKWKKNALHYALSEVASRKLLNLPFTGVEKTATKVEFLLEILPKQLKTQGDEHDVTPADIAANTPFEKYFSTTVKSANEG